MRGMIRQGDVLLFPIENRDRDSNAKVVAEGKVVLALGEKYGHSHVADSPFALLEESMNGDRVLVLPEETRIIHDEHTAISVPAGAYTVGVFKRYAPEGMREYGD